MRSLRNVRFMAVAVLSLAASAALANAQTISVNAGIKAGLPLTAGVEEAAVRPAFGVSQVDVERPAFAGGPTVEVSLGERFLVEINGVYRPIRFETVERNTCCTFTRTTRAHSVEVPVVANYRFTAGRVRPFVGFGFMIYNRLWGSTDSHGVLHDQGDRQTHVVFHFRERSESPSQPFLTGAGLEFSRGSITLRPQLRYTRWIGVSTRRHNHWEILVGVTLPVFRR
jgi:hypothetical protein